ncbi:hypothetical protein JCM19000A_04120 [Silvimonas sp. JCM 19000]
MSINFKRWIAAALGGIVMAGALVGCNSGDDSASATPTINSIKHVFVITLENENYSTTFGSSTKATYLAQTLAGQGALLQKYYGTGHVSLDNYIAMISGQSGNPVTNMDCQSFTEFAQTGTDADGQAIGSGCVYPASVKTLPDQLTAASLTWKGYMEDMGNDPSRESATCGHPVIGAVDYTQSPEASSTAVANGDQYATRHNPFMYFHSIIDNNADCGKHVVELNTLKSDLAAVSTTANFNFITPNLCHDGHDAPCVTGEAGGLTSADAFLKTWVPIITSSPAFKQDGLLIINFDEGSYAATTVASGVMKLTYAGETCCNQKKGPNLGDYPQTSALGSYNGYQIQVEYNSFGGDNTGAVLISPFIKAGTVTTTPYNHYSLLRSIEDIFKLSHLGYAAQDGLTPFGSDIFTNLK